MYNEKLPFYLSVSCKDKEGLCSLITLRGGRKNREKIPYCIVVRGKG